MIYDKEGNVYKLKGSDVKPIDNSQWDKIVLHNFEWDAVTIPDGNPDITKFKSDFSDIKVVPLPKIRESKTVEEPEYVPANKVVDPVYEPESETVVTYSDETSDFLQDNKITMWCLPVKRKEK